MSRKAYDSIFANRIKSIKKHCKIQKDSLPELFPAMFTVCDCAVLCAHRPEDRQLLMQQVVIYLRKKYKNLDMDTFCNRLDFYAAVIRGEHELRHGYYFGEIDKSDAVVCCTTALCDILWDPRLADDYDNAPVILSADIFAPMRFTKETFVPMYKEMGELYMEVYSL